MGAIVVILIIVVGVIMGVFCARGAHTSYRIGEGMFKHSEDWLDDAEELSDKSYYHEDGLLK